MEKLLDLLNIIAWMSFTFIIIAIPITIIKSIAKKSKKNKEELKKEWLYQQQLKQEQLQQKAQLQQSSPNQQTINDEYEEKEEEYPYRKIYLLTRNEWYFYKKLQPLAERYNLQITAKIRLADIVEVIPTQDKRRWGAYFSKIKSKHIDFALVNDNFEIQCLIELDDSSHKRNDRIERDNFVNNLCEKVGYKLIHTYGTVDKIENLLQTIEE